MRLKLVESDKYDWIRDFYSKVSPEAKSNVSKLYPSLLNAIEMYDEEIDIRYALATILGQIEDIAKDYKMSIEQLLNIAHEIDEWSNSSDESNEDLDEAEDYVSHHYMCQDEEGNNLKLFPTKYEAINYANEHPEVFKILLARVSNKGTDVSDNDIEWIRFTPDVVEGALDDLVQDVCIHNEDELFKGAGHVEYTNKEYSEEQTELIKELLINKGATTEDNITYNYKVPNKKYGVDEINITFKPDGGLIIDNPARYHYS